MSSSRRPLSLGLEEFWRSGIGPPRTPGVCGLNDQGDPNAWSFVGDTPGSLGVGDAADVTPPLTNGAGISQKTISGVESEYIEMQNDVELVLLAAVAYGEASTANVAEEISAIASVIVRQRDERDTTLSKLLSSKSTFAFAASDGNPRTVAFRKAAPAARIKNQGMLMALEGAKAALEGGADYSNGAYFWDGADIKTNYKKHPKVRAGIKFSKSEHNIYSIEETSVDKTEYVLDASKKPTSKVRGRYTYVYESTAGLGGTIFWKFGADFLQATGNQKYR